MLEVDVIRGTDGITFLRVTHNGQIILVAGDDLEPEDANFYRGLAWIPDIIKKAYELGRQEGR